MANDTMEAEVQGIKLKGTPAQIAEVIRLAGLATIPYLDPWRRWPLIPGQLDWSGPTCFPAGVTSTQN